MRSARTVGSIIVFSLMEIQSKRKLSDNESARAIWHSMGRGQAISLRVPANWFRMGQALDDVQVHFSGGRL
jgi:hypothetical protein